MPIQVLLDDGKYFLIARESLPKSHAFVITAALMHESRDLKFLKPTKATYGIPYTQDRRRISAVRKCP
jgi:hypothetical protein